MRLLMDKKKIKPKEYLNQSLEVIGTNFRAGKIDAAALWEPTVSRIGVLVGEGEARIAATGKVIGNIDSGSLVMRGDFIDKYPQLAEAYIKAELEAQRYMLDRITGARLLTCCQSMQPAYPRECSGILSMARSSAGRWNKDKGWRSFIWTDELRKNIEDMYVFLHKEKVIKYDKPFPGQ